MIVNKAEFLRNIDKFEQDLKDKLEGRLIEAAQVVETAAKQNVPVDTGALRDSIQSHTTKTESIIGTSLPYAEIVEGRTHYLQDALKDNVEEIIKILKGVQK